MLLTPEIMGCMQELPGEPALLFKEKINYKVPACRSDLLHQDQAAGWNSYSDFFITVALAVDQRMRYYQDKWQNYPPNIEQEYRSSDSFRV